jgi:hypothetical protein
MRFIHTKQFPRVSQCEGDPQNNNGGRRTAPWKSAYRRFPSPLYR